MTLRIEVDGETVESTLEDFLAVNETIHDDEASQIRALGVGQVYAAGGGAAAEWSVTRVA